MQEFNDLKTISFMDSQKMQLREANTTQNIFGYQKYFELVYQMIFRFPENLLIAFLTLDYHGTNF